MHLVTVSQGAIPFSQITDLDHRRGISVHRIDAFEHDQLRSRRAGLRQQLLQMIHVVVTKDALFASRLRDTLDHRVMVQGVREN
jgi:hypothetical protein